MTVSTALLTLLTSFSFTRPLLPTLFAASSRLPILSATFPDWAGLDLDAVRWTDYTELEFSVALTTPDIRRLAFTGMEDEETYMKDFTMRAKASGVRPSLSVGGWTGSRYFSWAVGSVANRTIFADTLHTALHEYGFEGVNLDWQYPGQAGIGCNEWSGADTKNLLLFAKVLRAKIGRSMTLSAAVPMTGFTDEVGDALSDTSAFAKYFDSLTLMAYDVAGNWHDATGPNAPLSAACAPTQQTNSVITAFEYWTSTGFPAKKLVLGIPSYGYIFETADGNLLATRHGPIPSFIYQPKTMRPIRAGPDDERSTDICGSDTDYSSSYTYNALVEADIITVDGKGKSGWTRYWDKCSATPFLHNWDTEQFITYDDPTSVAIKAYWAREHGMAGIKFFDYAGDNGKLVTAARKQLLAKTGQRLGINVDRDRQLIS